MYPILIEWGPVIIPAWHTFYVLGAIASYLLMINLARRHLPALADGRLAMLFTICYVSGYFGARLLSVLIEEPVTGPLDTVLRLGRLGAMTFYGGGIGCFIGGLIYVRLKRMCLADVLDLAIPAGLLALAIGRIGCFLNGDDFGLPVPLAPGQSAPWWAVTFPNLDDGLVRYPVQLISAGFVGLLVTFLAACFQKIRFWLRPGGTGFVGIVAYANFRYFVEFLRGDFRGSVLGGWLSTSQFISLVVLLLCAAILPFWLTGGGNAPKTTRDSR